MLIKEKSERNTLEMVSLEGLVAQGHLLRKIDCAVDLPIFMISWKTFIVRITGVPALVLWSCLRWSSSSACMESHPCSVSWKRSA